MWQIHIQTIIDNLAELEKKENITNFVFLVVCLDFFISFTEIKLVMKVNIFQY